MMAVRMEGASCSLGNPGLTHLADGVGLLSMETVPVT